MSALSAKGVVGIATSRHGKVGVACDLTNTSAVSELMNSIKPSAIIHCAAHVPATSDDYANIEAANSSLSMVQSLMANKPNHLIFASSMTVYPSDVAIPANEDAAGPPQNGYAGAKRKAEELLKSSGLPVTALRLPGLFGPPRRSGIIYNTAFALARGKAPVLPKDPPQWAALHVDDAAELCIRAALGRRPDKYRVLNAGYPDTMWIGKIVDELAQLMGGEPIGHPPTTPFAFDLARLRNTLGVPEFTLSERLAEMVEWVKAEAP